MATVVAFHAHPDDEAILTGGTLARLAAEGHRVVIVVACSGAMWPSHGTVRLEEFRRSAALLGAARAEHLGYYDSGHGPVLFPDPPDGMRFVRAGLEEAAGQLASILRAEGAELLLSYDPVGGYGHPDHIRVHEVGALAAVTPVNGKGRMSRLFRLAVTLPVPVFGREWFAEPGAGPGPVLGDALRSRP